MWEGRRNATTFRSVPVRFNIPRSGGMGETEHRNPVVLVCTGAKRRFALPIQKDGAYDRLATALASGSAPRQVRLCRRKGEFRIWVMTERDVPEVPMRPGQPVVGVDVGVRCLAAVSVVAERVREQHYLGRDIYSAQRDAGLRRSILQEGRDTGAMPDRSRRGLRRLRGWESRFTTTRSWPVAHQVVDLAERHGAAIAVEDLKGLREAPGHRKSRRKTARLPYSKFRSSLESLALERGVPLVAVPPAHTSRRCSRCGEMGRRSGASFSCGRCGYRANADRNASVNIARIARGAGGHGCQQLAPVQISPGGGRVNGPVGNEDGGVGVGRQPYHSPEFKPPISIGGR